MACLSRKLLSYLLLNYPSHMCLAKQILISTDDYTGSPEAYLH